MASYFKSTRRVEFCETDMAGIVHFSNFYKWMEQTDGGMIDMLQFIPIL